MNTEQLIFDLCAAHGVSGSEAAVFDVVRQALEPTGARVQTLYGGLLAELGDPQADKTILLDAHLDRIGFIITDINDKGFVKVDKVGGIDIRTLQDSVLIAENGLKGTVCCLPPHLSDGSEDKATPMEKTWVDFGLPAEAVREQLLRAAELIHTDAYRVLLLFSTQEETYGTGAKTGAFSVDADEAIAVDVSFAAQPDVSGQYGKIELGKGPMICYSSVMDRAMSQKLTAVAREQGIPFQLEPIAGATGTNGDHIAVSKSGVKTAVVSIPQRNMHTPAEVISLSDVENTARLPKGSAWQTAFRGTKAPSES